MGEQDLTLRELISKAFLTQHEGNLFFYDQREKEKKQLLKGIEDRNQKAEKGSDGVIDLNLTLSALRNNSEAFLRDIDNFIAKGFKGKYQYAQRFETLLNYMNDVHKTELPTGFLKKYAFKDDDRRRLEILKRMHAKNGRSDKTMAAFADEFGVDIKTIRNDFNQLERNFSFLDARITIKGFRAEYNSPVHPVFLALNSSQLYALFYALKVLSSGTVLEEFSQEISHSVYSQLTAFARGLVSDLYQSEELPEDFQNKYIDSASILRQQNRQVVFHAAAYKRSCSILFEENGMKRTVAGVPKVILDAGHDRYSVETEQGEIIEIAAESILEATELRDAPTVTTRPPY